MGEIRLIWVYAILALISLGAAFLLMWVKCSASKWLSAFMFFQAAYLGLILLDAQTFYISPLLYFLLLPIIYLPGPIILGYISHISTRSFISGKDFLLCLLPVAMVIACPELITDKSLWSLATQSDYQTTSYTGLFNVLTVMAAVQTGLYLSWSSWLILQLRTDWNLYQSGTLPQSWFQMTHVLAVIIIASVLQVISAFLNTDGNHISIGDVGFILQTLYFITISGKTAYHRLRQETVIQQPELIEAQEEVHSTYSDAPNDYHKEHQLILNKIEDAQWFLQSDLSLPTLAEYLETTTHKLSEAINRGSGQNFYEFINGFRIRYAAKQLTEDNNTSITDIFHNAGFTSKSSFYSCFKKTYGCTPTQYRKNTQTIEE